MAQNAPEPVTSPAPRVEREHRDLAELRASRRELADAVTRQIAFYVEHFGKTPYEAARDAVTTLPYEPDARDPEQIGWWELHHALDADPDKGQALWAAIKDDAREELATGFRTARSVEPSTLSGRPLDRAQYAVILETLREALRPRDGLEDLLVQQMAAAHEMHLRWLHRAVQRMDLEAWHGDSDRRHALERMSPAQRERSQETEGWVPSRLSDAEALDQAALIADRYQRSFLRLLKAFRDTRRMIGAVIVGEGGTLNVTEGPQQVNVNPPAQTPRRIGKPRAQPTHRQRLQNRPLPAP